METTTEQDKVEPGTDIPGGKKPYSTPRLEDYGDLRDLTLGGSPFGSLDSGDGMSKYPA